LRERFYGAVEFTGRPVHEQVIEAIAAGRIKRGEHCIHGGAAVVVVVGWEVASPQSLKQYPGQSGKAQYEQKKIFKCHSSQIFNVIAIESSTSFY
jgi:hypothetical protein